MIASLIQTAGDGSQNRTEETALYSGTVDQPLKNLSIQSSPRISKAPLGGLLSTHGSETNYLGATHWATILQNVSAPLVEDPIGIQLRHPRSEKFKDFLNLK